MELDLCNALAKRAYFFDAGLHFECLQCGDCCTGAHGTIYVGDNEIESIASHLQLTVDEFHTRYLYAYKDSYSISEDRQGRCLFYNDGCTIYELRPYQCRTYPFWFSNVRSENRWRRVAGQCPGIGRGRHFTKDEILQVARTTIHL